MVGGDSYVFMLLCLGGDVFDGILDYFLGGRFLLAPVEVETDVVGSSPVGAIDSGAVAWDVVWMSIHTLGGVEFFLESGTPSHVDKTPYLDLTSEYHFEVVARSVDAAYIEWAADIPNWVFLGWTIKTVIEVCESVSDTDGEFVGLPFVF